METKVYPTFRDAIASVMPDKFPVYWVGVGECIPNYEADSLTVRESRITGNIRDGFRVDTAVYYRRIVAEYNSEHAAKMAVDHNAGHKDTGWYTQRVMKTGIQANNYNVTVIELTPIDDS